MYATDNTTFISPIGLAFCLLMGLLMLVLPRRYAMLPVVALVCYMTMGQRVLILGGNFTMIRILLLFGFMRVLLRGEAKLEQLTSIDRAILWWVLSSIVTYTLLWKTGDAFINRLGLAYDALGLFFLFRFLVRDIDDMRAVITQFAILVIPLALCMVLEKSTGRNPFGALGGVPPITIIREGVLRCQGPFAHPILAGSFGSALIPLFVGLGWQKTSQRLLPALGVVSAVAIVVCAGSSGPLMATGLGLLGIGLWKVRDRMRLVRWGVAAGLVGLHLVMKAPVWFLLARVGVFGGSTGYHRAILIDHAIHRFPEWWLLGTYSTAHWGYYMFDVTNQYILIGVQGGILTMILFLTIIARGFGTVGRTVRSWEGAGRSGDQHLVWALGGSLMVHAANYISVPYFDQNIVNWYLLLAMIAMIGIQKPAPQPAKESVDGGREATRRLFLPLPAQRPAAADRSGLSIGLRSRLK